MKRQLFMLFIALQAWGQANRGQLSLRITDTSGAAIAAIVRIVSPATEYDREFSSNRHGALAVYGLQYGIYRVEVRQPGFAPFSETVDVRSAVPVAQTVRLSLATVATLVNVTAGGTLIDPDSPSSMMRIGAQQIEQRLSSLPGRSVQDLVDSQPGWLYEGNAVLHPRGSEYQTQFVVDGIPLTDNRSPSFGPEIEADDLESLSIYTAGYPAAYGRKMGGVVELNTRQQSDPGVHGQVVLSGGSYDTAAGYGRLQAAVGKNAMNVSGSGSMTSHYLNPVVPQNYTNTGTTGAFSLNYTRDFSEDDRLSLGIRHSLSRFLIPNEFLQQQAEQVQNGDNFETMETISYRHILSPNSLVSLSGMVREHANDLLSNRNPTPIAAFQHNAFREIYFKGAYTFHHGRQEFKVGGESDATLLHENFSYTLTDPTQFDDDTPSTLSFVANRPDLEQSGFAEDNLHLGAWTLNAGLRWDHYQLLLNRNGFSPRLALGRSVPSLRMVLHASFDRVFETPSSQNILLSSSPVIEALSAQFLRLPVQPSRGSYYEGGLSEDVSSRARLDVNVYRRELRNFADDDQLLNTGVSYPIAFDKAEIYGAEGKLELIRLQGFSGFVSYSYMVGNVWFPVTGGLFLGGDAAAALAQLAGHFPDSQDQRNNVRARLHYRLGSRAWLAGGASFGSGLPFAYEGDAQTALAQYGPAVVNRLNFARGRTSPLLSVNASLGIDLPGSDRFKSHLQIDGENLNNRLNVIDFGGLFSGNAIGPARSFAIRLHTDF